MLLIAFFFFKQKTAYELRISDWSSDVCSSDLFERWRRLGCRGAMAAMRQLAVDLAAILDRDRFITNVARDPRGCVDDQRLGLDRPVEQARHHLRPDGRRATFLTPPPLAQIRPSKDVPQLPSHEHEHAQVSA